MAAPKATKKTPRPGSDQETPESSGVDNGGVALAPSATTTSGLDKDALLAAQKDMTDSLATHVQILQKRLAESQEYNKDLAAQVASLTNEVAALRRNQDEFLQDGAFLAQPDPETRLNKLVLACVDCYKSNKNCEALATCHSCKAEGTKCRRLRCGRVKLTPQGCPDGLFCSLRHDTGGWLMSDRERANW